MSVQLRFYEQLHNLFVMLSLRTMKLMPDCFVFFPLLCYVGERREKEGRRHPRSSQQVQEKEVRQSLNQEIGTLETRPLGRAFDYT